MTGSPDETGKLERRAVAMRTRLVDTIDALERRGAHIVATVNDARRLVALAADAAAVLGAVATLFALVRSGRRMASPPRLVARERPHVLRHVLAFGALVGVAYVARRARRAARRTPMHVPRLRAIS
jgi:hypothetical protein